MREQRFLVEEMLRNAQEEGAKRFAGQRGVAITSQTFGERLADI